MSYILNIETATKVCSVAIGRDGELIALKETDKEKSHSSVITIFIQEVLKEAGIALSDLDAVAVSKGPGSYTGLRIGVSTAKGLCYSLDKPLIAISTLQAMARDLSLTLSEGEGTPARRHPLFSEDSRGKLNPRFHTTGKLDWSTSIVNVKDHRKNPTETEWIIWQRLRAKQLGYKFRRQHPIDKYIVDFVCIEKKLVIEIDGKLHEYQKEEDEERTFELNQKGFRVIRFKNEEVIVNTDGVIRKIEIELSKVTHLPLCPLRRSGDPVRWRSLSFGEGRGEVLFCPMIDARRMEVYAAFYDVDNNEVRKPGADIIDENSYADILDRNKAVFFGDGAAKCKDVLSHYANAVFVDNVFPSARNMIRLSEKAFNDRQFEDVAYFEPYYLKDFIAGIPASGDNKFTPCKV